MAASGRIRRRLALAIVLTALIPLLAAVWLAESTVRQTSARFFIPDVGAHLDKSLGLYQELARSMKGLMRQEAAEIALRPALGRAAAAGDHVALETELKRAFVDHPSLVSLSVRDADGKALAELKRNRPLDPNHENQLEVGKSLREGPDADDGPQLLAVFAADKSHFDELAEMSQFVDTYKQVERRREADERSYVLAFSALLGITIVAAIGVGTLLARGVSRRIAELARATRLVGEGDLNIRVPEGGGDEIADLAGAFNRMLGEVESSRARIEYLQRISAWQEMARRLAHEIKNPLTPISARRCRRSTAATRAPIRSTTGWSTPRWRSSRTRWARCAAWWASFRTSRACRKRAVPRRSRRLLARTSGAFRRPRRERDSADSALEELLRWAKPRYTSGIRAAGEPCEARIDTQMLRRVLFNLVRNAAQALLGERHFGQVRVRRSRAGSLGTWTWRTTAPASQSSSARPSSIPTSPPRTTAPASACRS